MQGQDTYLIDLRDEYTKSKTESPRNTTSHETRTYTHKTGYHSSIILDIISRMKPIILDIDYTPSHIATLLTAQTNDHERYVLVEKIVIVLINKNKEQKDLLETKDKERKKLLNEHKELLDNYDKLLHEQEQLLVMSAQQLSKIQDLENQLESVKRTPWIYQHQANACVHLDTGYEGKLQTL